MTDLKIVESFGNRIDDAIKRSGKNQSHVARSLGITHGSISNYKYGLQMPNMKTVCAIAKYLNCNELWLLGYNVPFGRKLNITEVIQDV